MSPRLLFSLAWTLLAGVVHTATSQNVEGRVLGATNEGNEPLSGAYVIWAGTAHGTITDPDGNFSLQFYEGGRTPLVISYVGYVSDTLRLSAPQRVEVTLQPEVMEQVDVNARRVGTSLDRRSALLTQNVTADELCKAACCNLGESFQTNASVDVSYSDAATGARTIQLLGLAGRYVQFMNENVPTLRGLASPFGLSYVPGPWMRGIQISKGAGRVINGYEALTGQINIDYKKPVATDELVSLNVFGSSAGRIEINASGNINVGPTMRTQLMANLATDLRDMDDNDDLFRDEPRVRQMNLFNRWYRHTEFYTLDLAIKTLNERRLGGSVFYKGGEPQSSDGQNPDHYGLELNTDRVEVWMKNGFVFSDRFTFGFPIGYTYHFQRSRYGPRRYVGTQHSYVFNAVGNLLFGERHELDFGAASQGDFYDEGATMQIYAPITLDPNAPLYQTAENSETWKPETLLGHTEHRSWTHNDVSVGLYAQYTLKIDDKFSLVAGLRLDAHNHYHALFTPRLHLRWSPTEHTTVRAAIGKSFRAASLLAENNVLLASDRFWIINNNYGQERGWNMGLNITQYIPIGSKELSLTAEYYHTLFQKQMTTDLDWDARLLEATYSTAHSTADNIQVEAHISPVRGLDVTAAWRWNGSRQNLGGIDRRRPLVSRYKALFALSYQTPLKTWQFDVNAQLNGGGRIPTTASNPIDLQRRNTFPAYQIYNAQVTKWFRHWSIYLGCENIGSFTQKNPIIAANDPFGGYFDSSLIWGPMSERKFFIGARWQLDKKSE